MGWKGAVRSIGAAVRAAEMDAKRRRRELEKRQKELTKMQELEQAAYEVELFENHIELIQSLHKECSDTINWKKIALSQAPKKPENPKLHERTARTIAEDYKPGFMDKVFKKTHKKKAQLDKNIIQAIEKDTSDFNECIAIWQEKFKDWKESVELANLLLKGNKEAKLKAIKDLDPFSEISNIGSKISIIVNSDGIIEATIHIHGDSIVPNEIKYLLKTGKQSIKKMPKGQFNEIYQDYVCSSVLRIANELFSAIPDDMVIITAVDKLLNTKTEHLEEVPILSACISRSTLESLNMEYIDPSDSMSNFYHNMSFKKNKGFEAVPRLRTNI